MSKTGIDFRDQGATGIDREHLKYQLDIQKENNKLNFEFKGKWVENMFSPSFLAFLMIVLMIVSGFIYMRTEGVTKSDIMDYWKLIIPAITTYIGYAIGKSDR